MSTGEGGAGAAGTLSAGEVGFSTAACVVVTVGLIVRERGEPTLLADWLGAGLQVSSGLPGRVDAGLAGGGLEERWFAVVVVTEGMRESEESELVGGCTAGLLRGGLSFRFARASLTCDSSCAARCALERSSCASIALHTSRPNSCLLLLWLSRDSASLFRLARSLLLLLLPSSLSVCLLARSESALQGESGVCSEKLCV